MSYSPPPQWPPPEKPPVRRGHASRTWQRWRAWPRWAKVSSIGGVAVLAIGAIGSLADPDRPTEVSTDTPASTPAPTTAATPTTGDTTTTAPTTTGATTTTTVATTTVATTTTAPAGYDRAIDVLAMIPVANEVQGGYSRDVFAEGLDEDGDGCATRAEVLIRSSATPAQIDASGCGVVAGEWRSLYDGMTYSDPSELEVDHVVALKEAWDSGAHAWDAQRRAAFANDLQDPRTLVAVTGGVNSAKGDKDPSNWLPPDDSDVCRFVGDWIAIKARWGLNMDQSEHGRLGNLLEGPCAGWSIAPWPPTAPAVPAPTAPPPPPTAAPAPPPPAPGVEVYYENCGAARAAGAAPLYRGSPATAQAWTETTTEWRANDADDR